MATLRTRTVKSSGGDYGSLNAWEAGEQADLPAADEIRRAEVYGMLDTTAVTIDGWTTDATRYFEVVPATGAEARLPYDTSGAAYRLEGTDTNPLFRIQEAFGRVSRIQLKVTSTGAAAARGLRIDATAGTTASQVRIVGCVVLGSLASTNATQVGLDWFPPSGFTGSGVIANNVFVNWNSSGAAVGTAINFTLASGSFTCFAYNNTAVHCYRGFNAPNGSNAPSSIRLKNNGYHANGISGADGYATGTGSWHSASDYNASNLAGDAPGSNSRNSVTPSFVDLTGRNLRLMPSDTAWRNFATDLSADADYAFSDDWHGETRSTWDIGADEYASDLAATVSATGAMAGALTTDITLAAAPAGTATTAGAVTTDIRLAATPSASAAVAGALATDIRLAGTTGGEGTTASVLATDIRLVAAVVGAATITGALAVGVTFAGALAAAATATGRLAAAGAGVSFEVELLAACAFAPVLDPAVHGARPVFDPAAAFTLTLEPV